MLDAHPQFTSTAHFTVGPDLQIYPDHVHPLSIRTRASRSSLAVAAPFAATTTSPSSLPLHLLSSLRAHQQPRLRQHPITSPLVTFHVLHNTRDTTLHATPNTQRSTPPQFYFQIHSSVFFSRPSSFSSIPLPSVRSHQLQATPSPIIKRPRPFPHPLTLLASARSRPSLTAHLPKVKTEDVFFSYQHVPPK